jgi:hypothetical protein
LFVRLCLAFVCIKLKGKDTVIFRKNKLFEQQLFTQVQGASHTYTYICLHLALYRPKISLQIIIVLRPAIA